MQVYFADKLVVMLSTLLDVPAFQMPFADVEITMLPAEVFKNWYVAP
jgi:hypothetical protein